MRRKKIIYQAFSLPSALPPVPLLHIKKNFKNDLIFQVTQIHLAIYTQGLDLVASCIYD